jgi:hypothetical protein
MKRNAIETNESDGEDSEEVNKKLSYVIEKIVLQLTEHKL